MWTLKKFVVGSLGLVVVGGLALRLGTGGFSLDPLAPIEGETRRLDADLEAAHQRITVTEDLAQSLLDGRVSLAEAARGFLALHENDPIFRYSLERDPGRTPFEVAARNMAERAYYRSADAWQRERAGRRLSDEFRSLFPQAEPLRFEPGPPPVPPPQLVPRPGGRPLPVPVPLPGPHAVSTPR